ncbi:NUDIX hydrolase [Lutimaribacter sp. EGI FJ00015]|uniref:NUDIX hydrolase n=1 Tax=Lutimaribacter degradans TaxID=2945989 RepID=A0ACC5ZUS3_9RHOB|nr:NUDIX hydrolase [Lutimaribacter sp. EGI FJ00013]MCM2561516.1 NUDIX hydrolase [Lutimaribacter sp. EGI FJ00013]MCO0612773.1 NUDIX hydrolase [Lutimaribacter sp. EGI FJ00015]MCO0635431.1 NUDIX hydrolase [Lutimaribacter sp. EGI FJ00014]
MTGALKKAWAEVVQPMIFRPRRFQVAALCCKTGPDGLRVLLITSRDTGRWILPKGWPIDGLTAPEAALQEAWEEAGVKEARIEGGGIGRYDYDKRLRGGVPVPVEVQVYRVEVLRLSDTYPEVDERTRRWVSPAEAAELVDEDGLKALLLQL